MPELISQVVAGYLTQLMKFRGTLLGVQKDLQARGRPQLNLAEFVLGYCRGGRRFPIWMLKIDDSIHSRPYSIDNLTAHGLRDFYDTVLDLLSKSEVVPKTKCPTLAAYLTGKMCATASTLSQFAGISNSTAHVWLKRCSEIGILERFQTVHEFFYFNPRLIELTIIGFNSDDERFTGEIRREIAELRKRRNWFEQSPSFSFYGFDYGQNFFNPSQI